MKTSYSRRELYALGEPIGESSTYELAGRRVYGGGGGIVGDIVGGVSDIVGGAVDTVGNLGQDVIDTAKDNPALTAAALAAATGGLGGLGGLGAEAGITGLGDAAAWDAATADMIPGGLDPYEIFGSGASQWGGAGDYMDLGAVSGTDLGGAGGSPASWGGGGGFGGASQIAKMLGKSISGDPNGLTYGGGLLGAAGIAGLMNMIKKDNERFGTPGRQDMQSPLTQFKYNPATFSAPKVDPAAFRPVGVPTAKIGYAMGGDVQMDPNLQQVPTFDPVVRMADGGITGQGSIELNVPLSIGGDGGALGQFGQSMQGGFPASASNPFRGYNNTPSMNSVMSNPQQFGLDKNAIAANPQQFASMYQQAQQREQSMPGSTFLSQSGGMGLGGLFGGQPVGRPSYEQYVAGRNPIQQDVQMTRDQYNSANTPQQILPARFMASGGIADLGGYSDGGRMLKGPGDGMSDSIPASIADKQPARLADGEFVVPADVVSHLGNGSTDAGAKQLYKMMDKVRQARTGRKSQGKQINPKKYMPA